MFGHSQQWKSMKKSNRPHVMLFPLCLWTVPGKLDCLQVSGFSGTSAGLSLAIQSASLTRCCNNIAAKLAFQTHICKRVLRWFQKHPNTEVPWNLPVNICKPTVGNVWDRWIPGDALSRAIANWATLSSHRKFTYWEFHGVPHWCTGLGDKSRFAKLLISSNIFSICQYVFFSGHTCPR